MSSYELSKEQLAEVKKEITEEFGKDIANNVVDEEAIRAAAEEYEKLKAEVSFDLDAALDTYDPTFPRYTPSKEALEFFNLMRLVQGQDFEFDTPIAHYFMADLLLGGITDVMQFPYSEEVCKTIELDPLRIGFMASRGLAKSTLVISFFSVYSAIKGELPNGIGKVYFYLLIAASSKGGARVNALAVRAMCEDSEFLQEYFEEMRFTETESEFVRKGSGPKKNRSFLIRYQGYSTGIRGSRYGERRPDTIIMDDAILNTAAAYSKIISDNLEEVIYSDAINALKGGGKGRVLLCFTPFHYGDVNTKALLQGAFTQCVVPIAKSFDENTTLKEKDITSSWEAMHPAKAIAGLVRSAKKAKKLKGFMQERMLRLTSGSERLVPDSCIQWYDVQNVINRIDYYNVYITTDYTTTSGEKSDYSGIASWAVSNNEDWFLLNVSLRKRSMAEQYNDTLEEAARWKRRGKHVEIGVETDGNQGAHIYALEQEMLKRGDFFTFAKQKGKENSDKKGLLSKSTGVNKHERFRIAVSQVVLPKKMWFPEHLKGTPDMEEFLDQIRGATHESFTKSDDGPDLITQGVVTMKVIYPTEAPMTEDNKLTEVADSIWGSMEKEEEIRGGSTIF